MARKVILDVDTGIDDALALLLALASPELDFLGITCVAGNVTIDQVTRNTLNVVEIAGRDVPVAVGARKPLMNRLRTATLFHGANGLANITLPAPALRPIDEPAPAFLTRMVREQPGEITVVAVGPLTNIALAIIADAGFAANLAGLIVMGGTVGQPGNTSGGTEANFSNDPEAARGVVESGVPLILVDLGATTQVTLPMSRLEPAAERQLSPVGDLALKLLQYYGPMYVSIGYPGPVLHDPLAVGLAAVPDLATYPEVYLEVETAGRERGASIGSFSPVTGIIKPVDDHLDTVGVAPRPFNARLARNIASERFLSLFLMRVGLAE
ncbi:MAG TPA: nucleoside hydrolase [Chloroflexota bacterium]|nr:nucleoside hydrolase [Chloroflexota bacterium]